MAAVKTVQKLKREEEILESAKQPNKLKYKKATRTETEPDVTKKVKFNREEQAGEKSDIPAQPTKTKTKKKGIVNEQPVWPHCCHEIKDQFDIAVALQYPGYVQYSSVTSPPVTVEMIKAYPKILFVTMIKKEECKPPWIVTTTGALQRDGHETLLQNHLPLFTQIQPKAGSNNDEEWAKEVELLFETCDNILKCSRVNGTRFLHVVLPPKAQFLEKTTGEEQSLITETVNELINDMETNAHGRKAVPSTTQPQEPHHSWRPEQELNQVDVIRTTKPVESPPPATSDPEANDALGPPYHRQAGTSHFKYRGLCDKVPKRILQERTSVNAVHVTEHGSVASREELVGSSVDVAKRTQQLEAIKIKLKTKQIDDHSLTEEEIELWRTHLIKTSTAQVEEEEMEAYHNKQRKQEQLMLKRRAAKKAQKATGSSPPYFRDDGTKESDEETAQMSMKNQPYHWEPDDPGLPQVRQHFENARKDKELKAFYDKQKEEKKKNQEINTVTYSPRNRKGIDSELFERLMASIR